MCRINGEDDVIENDDNESRVSLSVTKDRFHTPRPPWMGFVTASVLLQQAQF